MGILGKLLMYLFWVILASVVVTWLLMELFSVIVIFIIRSMK